MLNGKLFRRNDILTENRILNIITNYQLLSHSKRELAIATFLLLNAILISF